MYVQYKDTYKCSKGLKKCSFIRHVVQSSYFVGACFSALERCFAFLHFHSSILEPYLDVFL